MGAGCVLYAVVRAANRERGIERRVEEARGSMWGEGAVPRYGDSFC